MKILIVLTSHDTLGNTGRKTGFWLEELAAPYYTFTAARAELVLASPKGGQPPLDPKSNEPSFQTDLTRRWEADSAAKAQLAYWQARLDGLTALPLRGDRKAPALDEAAANVGRQEPSPWVVSLPPMAT